MADHGRLYAVHGLLKKDLTLPPGRGSNKPPGSTGDLVAGEPRNASIMGVSVEMHVDLIETKIHFDRVLHLDLRLPVGMFDLNIGGSDRKIKPASALHHRRAQRVIRGVLTPDNFAKILPQPVIFEIYRSEADQDRGHAA